MKVHYYGEPLGVTEPFVKEAVEASLASSSEAAVGIIHWPLPQDLNDDDEPTWVIRWNRLDAETVEVFINTFEQAMDDFEEQKRQRIAEANEY